MGQCVVVCAKFCPSTVEYDSSNAWLPLPKPKPEKNGDSYVWDGALASISFESS